MFTTIILIIFTLIIIILDQVTSIRNPTVAFVHPPLGLKSYDHEEEVYDHAWFLYFTGGHAPAVPCSAAVCDFVGPIRSASSAVSFNAFLAVTDRRTALAMKFQQNRNVYDVMTSTFSVPVVELVIPGWPDIDKE